MKKRLTNTSKKGIRIECFGDMAQLVERLVRNEEVTSSNLVISTRRNRGRTRGFFLFAQTALPGLSLKLKKYEKKISPDYLTKPRLNGRFVKKS